MLESPCAGITGSLTSWLQFDKVSNACRWDGCFIRFLDGMLQSSALGSTDYQLRIPVRLRHVAISNAAPANKPGTSGLPPLCNASMPQAVLCLLNCFAVICHAID